MNRLWTTSRQPSAYSGSGTSVAVPYRIRLMENTLIAFLVYGGFEGLLKRLTRYAWYIYPLKDVFFLAIMFAWIGSLRDREARVQLPFGRVVTGYLIVCVLEVLNPYVPSVIAGLTGLRGDYMFASLFFLTFHAIRTEEQVVRLARNIGRLAIITALGAAIESLLGIQWVYENQLQVAINANYLGVSGDYVLRPSSIANGPGSAAMFEFIGAGFLLGLGARSRTSAQRVLYLGGATAVVAAICLGATRIIWLMTAVAAGVFVLLIGRGRMIWALSVGSVVGLGVLLSVLFSSGEIIARFQTLETPVETYRAERFEALEILPKIISDYPFGAGVGWNIPRQLDVLSRFYSTETVLYAGVHNYLSILVLETSVVGCVLFIVFSLGVLLRGFMAIRREHDEARRTTLLTCYAVFAGIALSFPFGGAIVGWPGEYYWILAGIVTRFIVLGEASPRRAEGSMA